MPIRESFRTARIGIIQVNHQGQQTREERYAGLESLAISCLEKGADLVFFPEAFQHANDREILNRPDDWKRERENWESRCSALAKKYHAYIVPWDYLPDGNGGACNASYLLDRSGNRIGEYRKTHHTYKESEVMRLTRGTDYPVFDLDFGKVGIMICFDNYFPEVSRILALKGAELILYPLYGDTLPMWEPKLRTRAADNGVYIASCQIDMHAMQSGLAFSGMIAPDGEVLCRLKEPGSHAVVEIHPGAPVMTHLNGGTVPEEDLPAYLSRTRNPEVYGELVLPRERPSWDAVYTENALHKMNQK